MTPGQGLLIGSRTCRCGAPLPEYPGVGRPRALCDACYPTRAPVRKQHEVPAGVSGEPRARLSDPSTAHEAARIAKVNAGSNRAKALLALIDRGPMTDFELEVATGVKQTSIGKRRLDCERAGFVEWTGEKRPSPDGVLARVYRATESGIARARELRGTV